MERKIPLVGVSRDGAVCGPGCQDLSEPCRNLCELQHLPSVYNTSAKVLAVKTCPNPVGTYVSYSAYYYVHTGDAYMYHNQFLERLEALKGEEDTLVFEPYAYQPWLIYVGDGNEFPNQGNNYLLERWYGKDSVSVLKTEE
mgnify:CR=1 FL=1